jgi:hypothetical protein
MVADLSAVCAQSGMYNAIDQTLSGDSLFTLPILHRNKWRTKLRI